MTTAEVKPQLRLKNILVTTDFSKESAVALSFAVELCRQHGAKLVVLHAVPGDPFGSGPINPLHGHNEEVQLAKQEMVRFAEKEKLGALQHQEFVMQGDIWDVIRTAARDNEVDLIVLATHGRTGIKHIMMGSVAEQVFRNAICPVMTIGPHVTGLEGGRFRKILYATDFSESAERALPYAVSFARESNAILMALHVEDFVFGEGVDVDQEKLQGVEKLLRKKVHPPEGVAKFQYLARLGSPADGILTAAADQHADLIVIGLHRHSTLATHMNRVTAHQLVAHAMCPVLTVR
jgi:nucleotide-binding universal stress UspA family protein